MPQAHPTRRLGLALAILGLASLASACAPAGDTGGSTSSGAEVTITDAANGQPVALAQGQTLVVALGSNPTTGYSWAVTAPGTPQLLQQGEPSYAQDAASAGRMGAGGTQTFRFQAAEAGDTTLSLAYSRPFEAGTPPAATFSVPVTVK